MERPKCGCQINTSVGIIEENIPHLIDSNICLYPAAIKAYEDLDKIQVETLRLKRKRNRQLLEAVEVIKSLLTASAWPNTPVYEKAQLFINVIECKARVNADGDVCRCVKPECIVYNKGKCGCQYCEKAYAGLEQK